MRTPFPFLPALLATEARRRSAATLASILGIVGAWTLVAAAAWGAPPSDTGDPPDRSVLRRENLVAWCIVPFDAKRRGPGARAAMLKELGILRCAYDWRAEHVPTFEQEILAYQKQGIEFFAFWSVHDEAFRLFEQYDLHPQIWQTLSDPGGEGADKVETAAQRLLPLARRTAELDCPLGLYNHGGWGGEPANLVAVCQRLHELGQKHVGIVYNFHHGHGHIEDWKASFALMQPYLHCLNLNGMNPGADPKILGIGKGIHEQAMIRAVVEAGYDGPIGILDHRPELDAEASLRENRDGLAWIKRELDKPGSGGPKPSTPQPLAVPQPAPPQASPSGAGAAGHLYPGAAAYRQPPLTVRCRVTLPSSEQYHILVASDPKSSAAHWELFTMPGSGRLTAYLPGYAPDHVRSEVDVCDGQPHQLTMVYQPTQVRLFVDGRQVAQQTIEAKGGMPVPGGLGIGRLVAGSLRCRGAIDWVQIDQGVVVPTTEPLVIPRRTPATVGRWSFRPDAPQKETPAAGAPPQPPQPPEKPDAAETSAAETSAAESPSGPFDAERVRRLAAAAAGQGDPLRGARLFADAKLACLSCHRVEGQGGTVGPELSKVGQQRTAAEIVESVLWPDKKVEPEFVVWQCLTVSGTIHRGLRRSDPQGRIVLHDPASDKQVRLDPDEIEEEWAAGTLMPSELTTSLSRQQQADLVRFLTALGVEKAPGHDDWGSLLQHAQMHGPASFPLETAPLDPEHWPHASHQVNRDRLYDFYTKQAEYFRQQPHLPMLLTPYPGMDGAETGHWGNQEEADWADDRWNATDIGSLQAGVFHGPAGPVPRGVCVRLGEAGELAVCFDPDTLTYVDAWRGGFVRFSDVRHGFLHGLRPDGERVPLPPQQTPPEPFTYHGFYRFGKRVVFAYRIGETEYFDAPSVEAGELVREVAPREEHSLRKVLQGGPAQWPQRLATAITPGDQRPFAIDTIARPVDNPWNALIYGSGHAFLPDGSALVCTMQGDVWQVRGLDSGVDATGEAQWRRFAAGLHHPLGLVVADGQIYVQCRDQLTRLRDLNGDGEADFYECFSNAFETSPAGHDFICGLQRDAAGRFYTASGNQGLVRISADGQHAEVLATGFRNPDGLGLLPDGTVTVPCSEGTWTPASMICAVPPAVAGAARSSEVPLHYGYRGPREGQPPELPLVYLPRGIDNSSGGQVAVESPRWEPLQGQLLHFSFGAGAWFLVLRDQVAGQSQGAVVPLPGDFRSGVHRARFRPQDGQLYVTGMTGWGSYTPEDGCFQRIRYTGDPVQLPTAFHLHENGVRVRFAQPLDRASVEHVKNHFAQVWNYRYSGAYGSPEYSTTHPGVGGHDPLTIRSAHLLEDGHSLFLEIPDLQPVSQLHLRLHVNEPGRYPESHPSGEGQELFVTAHRLDRPFTQFPGYRPREKTIAAHPLLQDMALQAERVPNPWATPIEGARSIEIATGKNLTYATSELEVRANEPLAFTLTNPDVVPHNWVLVRPGQMRKVGELANGLIADPAAFARHYVPRSEEILAHTDIVQAGAEQTIYFRAPATPGRYPFLCTFPGHWMVMNGAMVVR